MPVDLYRSIVPIVRATETGGPWKFMATGIVVTPTVVITCKHAMEELFDDDSMEGREVEDVGALCASLVHRVTYARRSNFLDLCCLHFDNLPGMIPAPMARSARLTNRTLAAIGFPRGKSVDEHEIPELKA